MVTIWVVRLPKRTETGKITELDQTLGILHSRNSWFWFEIIQGFKAK